MAVDKTIFNINENNLSIRIGQAEMYLKEFENEVRRANGADFFHRIVISPTVKNFA